MVKKFAVVAVVVALAACLSSCGKKQAAEKPSGEEAGTKEVRVAFVTNNVSDFWKIAQAGVKKGEKEFNAVCEMKMPTQGTAAEQKVILEDLVTNGRVGHSYLPGQPGQPDRRLERGGR